MIKLRIILESKENVIRDIIINESLNLEKLNVAIINLFNLDKFEMSSFFITDSNLNLLEEIPLLNISEDNDETTTMNKILISSVLKSEESSLIYIYDFLKMWRFHIQYLEKSEETEMEDLICVYSVGDLPEKAPLLKFETDSEENSLDEDKLEDFDNLNQCE